VLQRGQSGEHRGDGDGQQHGEQERLGVERQGIESRKARRRETHQPTSAGQADQRGHRRPGQDQHERLGERLAHHVATSRADRRPHRELSAAGLHPHQEQVDHVRARDDQHEAHRAEENPQIPCRIAQDVVPKRVQHGVKSVSLEEAGLVDPGIRLDEPGGQQVGGALRRLQRDARREACDSGIHVAAVERAGRVKLHRHP
jgi:hypothetical protein